MNTEIDRPSCWLILVLFLSLAVSCVAAESYKIVIERGPKDRGTFTYTGSITITATCWWQETNRVPPMTDTTCSATTMATVGIPGVYIPHYGDRQIFIHEGKGPSSSLGCIAVDKEKFLQAWNDIKPKNGKNVTVTIKDQEPK